jgi:hypothetical protein
LAKYGDGFIDPALADEACAQVIQGIDMIGLELQGLSQLANGLVQTACVLQRNSAIAMRIRYARGDGDRPPEQIDGQRKSAGLPG